MPTTLIFTLILSFFTVVNGRAFAKANSTRLASGRSVVVTREVYNDENKWIVFLPGSSCALFDLQNSAWINTLRGTYPFNILVLNKAGISLDGHCRQAEFNEGSLRQNRIDDILSTLKSEISPRAQIILMAESEGAYIAPDIAVQRPDVSALILFSGGTRSWIDEEIMAVPAIQREELRKFFTREVVGSNDLLHFYRGWPYAQLSSYDTSATIRALRRLTIPIAAFHGEKDRAIWVEATIQDFAALIHAGQKNIESHVIPNAGHGLHCAIEGGCGTLRPEDSVCERLLSFTGQRIR